MHQTYPFCAILEAMKTDNVELKNPDIAGIIRFESWKPLCLRSCCIDDETKKKEKKGIAVTQVRCKPPRHVYLR